MPIFEPNSIKYLAIIAISIALAVFVHPLLILLWVVILLVDDVMYFRFQRTIFDSEIAIQRGYQFANIFLEDQSGAGRDLGFNVYDGDLQKTREQSQQDKWDFMIESLNLNAGDRLLDIGCGYGDWLNYARSQGMEVMGVNISPDQANEARANYDLEILNINWKDIPASPALQEQLYGKFDAVTFMDTIEHYVPSMYRKNDEKLAEIYGSMFDMACELLKPDSDSGCVFISCLHMTRDPETVWDDFACYLQTRYHSGYYPKGDDGLTRYSGEYFQELARYDKTEDYRLTSVIDENHFGSPNIKWTPHKVGSAILLFFLDPHHVHKWLEINTDAWMWHFGKDAFNPNYDNEHQKQSRFVTLWWLVLQKRAMTESTG